MFTRTQVDILMLIKVFHVKIMIHKIVIPVSDVLSIKSKACETVSSAVWCIGGLISSTPPVQQSNI